MLAGNKALDQASLAIYRKPNYSWYNSNLTYGTITACLFMTQKHGYYCKQTKQKVNKNSKPTYCQVPYDEIVDFYLRLGGDSILYHDRILLFL